MSAAVDESVRSRTRDWIPPLVAGALVVLVSYSGPMLIVRLAAANAHLSEQVTDSWIASVSIGSGLTAIVLSLWLRQPIVTAFSSAGMVLLTTSLSHYRFDEAIAAYLVVAVACVLIGITGSFSKLIAKIPSTIVSAMLAGVLFKFGTDYFSALPGKPERARITVLVLAMGVVYFGARALKSRVATVWACGAGLLLAFALRLTTGASISLRLAKPVFTSPSFSVRSVTGLALPLLALALSSQYAPGYAVLRESGYQPDMNRVLAVTGGVGLVLGMFGSPGVNLAAITAGIATGPDAHPDPSRRYRAGVVAGIVYVTLGLFGVSVLDLFKAVPPEFVAAITGLALFGTIVNAAASALADPATRDAAGVTLLCAAGGFTLFQIGAPFWALVAGIGVTALRSGTERLRSRTRRP